MNVSNALAGRLAGCLAGLLAGWLAGWLTGWVAGWLAGGLAGGCADLMGRKSNNLTSKLSVHGLAGWLVVRLVATLT